LTRLDQVLLDEPAQLIGTVHDEAVLLVPDDLRQNPARPVSLELKTALYVLEFVLWSRSMH
jgi:hypothetical protein